MAKTTKGLTQVLWASIYRSDQYKAFKLSVKKRDNRTCTHCGCKKTRANKIHVHHGRPKAKFCKFTFEPEYAFLLCSECHIEEHKKLSKEHPEWTQLPNATSKQLAHIISTLTYDYYNNKRKRKRKYRKKRKT